MSHFLCTVAAGLFLAALNAPNPAHAQQPKAPPPLSPPALVSSPDFNLLLPRVGLTLEHYFQGLRQDFILLDADGDGTITQRDVDFHASMETVILRTFAMQFVMQYDLDADCMVTEDEVRRGASYNFRSQLGDVEKQIDDAVRSVMALDADNDGKVSVAEAARFSYPEMHRNLGFPELPVRARRALTLESAVGGEITLRAYEAAGEAIFRRIDTDQDGKISQAELDGFLGPR